MQRFNDWQQRLFVAIAARNAARFKYGGHDCCLAASDLINAFTDVDLMEDFRGQYKSAAGAFRLMRKYGFNDLIATLAHHIPKNGGKALKSVLKAGTGDLVTTDLALHDECLGQACGVVVGSTAIFPASIGWVHLPRRDWRTAFKIG